MPARSLKIAKTVLVISPTRVQVLESRKSTFGMNLYFISSPDESTSNYLGKYSFFGHYALAYRAASAHAAVAQDFLYYFAYNFRLLISKLRLSRWDYWLDSRLPVLNLFLAYLLFKGLPLCFGEDAGVVLLPYFHLSICYLDYWASTGCSA